jgi:hypothetical protein
VLVLNEIQKVLQHYLDKPRVCMHMYLA